MIIKMVYFITTLFIVSFLGGIIFLGILNIINTNTYID
jgi:hypothetical protein